jgi:hypothetical protein
MKNINFTQLSDLESVQEAPLVLLQGGVGSYDLMAGNAEEVNDFEQEFTGWFQRKVCSDGSGVQNAIIIFSTAPFQVFCVSSDVIELYQVEMAAYLYAIDNRTVSKKEKTYQLTKMG